MHKCVSNVFSSISQHVNDSFKENSYEECEAFIETLVTVVELENHECMKVVMEKNHKIFSHLPDEPSKLRNLSPLKLLSFTVYEL